MFCCTRNDFVDMHPNNSIMKIQYFGQIDVLIIRASIIVVIYVVSVDFNRNK